MRTTNRAIWILATVAFIGMAALPIDVLAGEGKHLKEFMEVRNRITALGRTKDLSKAEKENRLQQLEALGQEIERKWRDTDVEKYARLMFRVSGTIGGLDVPAGRRNYIAQNVAFRALEKADDMPLDAQCDLLEAVRKNVGRDGKRLKGNPWAQLRKNQVTLQLRGWQRIDKTIDKNWDPNDLPAMNVSPPAATGLPSGVAPEAIADPQLRAEYEAAIEANRQKAARSRLQSRARKLKKRWIRRTERFIIRRYMEAPGRLAELEALLKVHVADADKRARILTAVKNKKMPDDLILRPRTQPAE